MNDQYAQPYSDLMEGILLFERRKEVGNQIISVLQNHLRKNTLNDLTCLEIGTSAGVIGSILSSYFKKVIAIDIDRKAAKYWKRHKKKNLVFKIMDASHLRFRNSVFDVVISNQNYNFIKDPQAHINEMFRVLKPGGICFFGARNKLNIIEGQYNLPFLSWLPYSLARRYIEATGRKHYFLANYKTMWELKKMCSKFIIHDYTIQIIKYPKKYNYVKLLKYQYLLDLIPTQCFNLFEFLIPNFIWILQKPSN